MRVKPEHRCSARQPPVTFIYPNRLFRFRSQYADARARLAEAGGYGSGIFGGDSLLSLGQSDVFFDCVEGSDDGIGGGAAHGTENGKGTDRRDAVKLRVRMTGLDVTLLLPEGEEPTDRSSSSGSTSHVRLQMRRMGQTVQYAEGWVQAVAEIGTFAVNWKDGIARDVPYARVVEGLGAADLSPSIQVTCSGGVGESRGRTDRADEGEVAVDVECMPVAAVLDARLAGLLRDFVGKIQPAARPTQPVDRSDVTTGNGRAEDAASSSKNSNMRDRRVSVTVAMPKLTVRLPADPSACSSAAHSALISSVQNGSSPVGWASREEVEGDSGPMLVLEFEGTVIRVARGSPGPQETRLECTRMTCQMLLVCLGGIKGGKGTDVIGLYFLEASRAAAGPPLTLEYGLANDIRKPGQLGVARSVDADLNFLHTWEPNDG